MTTNKDASNDIFTKANDDTGEAAAIELYENLVNVNCRNTHIITTQRNQEHWLLILLICYQSLTWPDP